MENYVGEIRPFAGGRIPEGWLLCDGTELPISQYQTLFSLIKVTYGGNVEQGKFRLPDLRSRIPLGLSSNYQIGRAGGEEFVKLTPSHLPKHKHPIACSTSVNVDLPTAADGVWSASAAKGFLYNPVPGKLEMNKESISMEGNGLGHENRMPVMAVSFLIAYTGLYPSRS